ncbi:MAG: tetratricopeptide repeat protein [Acidobacteriota bacterium]
MMLAQCWSAHSLLRLPDLKQSLLLYQSLLPACSQYRYRWLQSQILNAIADNQSSRSQYSQALDYADQSRAIALKIEDTAGALRNLQFGLSMKLQFGNYRDSLTYSAQAFELAQNTIGEPRQLWHLYFENALNFLQLDLPTAALSFQHEALRLALASSFSAGICRSYMRLGMLYDRLEDYQQSLKYLQLALAEGQKIPLTEGQIDLTSHTWLQLGLVHLRHNAPQQALSCFEQASSQFLNSYPLRTVLCAQRQIWALLQLGRDQKAGQELAQALQPMRIASPDHCGRKSSRQLLRP